MESQLKRATLDVLPSSLNYVSAVFLKRSRRLPYLEATIDYGV